jgi:hypothetical protein
VTKGIDALYYCKSALLYTTRSSINLCRLRPDHLAQASAELHQPGSPVTGLSHPPPPPHTHTPSSLATTPDNLASNTTDAGQTMTTPHQLALIGTFRFNYGVDTSLSMGVTFQAVLGHLNITRQTGNPEAETNPTSCDFRSDFSVACVQGFCAFRSVRKSLLQGKECPKLNTTTPKKCPTHWKCFRALCVRPKCENKSLLVSVSLHEGFACPLCHIGHVAAGRLCSPQYQFRCHS